MILIELLGYLFGNSDVDRFSALLFLFVPFLLVTFMVIFSFMKCMNPRDDRVDLLLYIPPYFLYGAAMIMGFVLNLLICCGWDTAYGLAQMVNGTGDGPRLHAEILVIQAAYVVLFALLFLYRRFFMEPDRQGKAGRVLFYIAGGIDLACVLGLVVMASQGLSGSQPELPAEIAGNIWGALEAGIPAAVRAEAYYGLYYFGAFAMAFKAVLLAFVLVWVLLFGNRGKDKVKGDNPLERLAYQTRRLSLRRIRIMVILAVFLAGMMLPAILSETWVYDINGPDPDWGKLRYEYVRLRDPQIIEVSNSYNNGRTALLYVHTADNLAFYVLAEPEQAMLLERGRPKEIVGKLSPLSSYQSAMEKSIASRAGWTMPDYYIDHRSTPDYSVMYFLLIFACLPLLGLIRFLPAALNPKRSKAVKAMYAQYPNLDAIMDEVAARRGTSGMLFESGSVTVTDSYLILEPGNYVTIIELARADSYSQVNERVLKIHLSDGRFYHVSIQEPQGLQAALSVLAQSVENNRAPGNAGEQQDVYTPETPRDFPGGL